MSQIQILFDSNLSREIMISLSEVHLADQEPGTPSSLVKSFMLEMYDHGTVVYAQRIQNNHQRRVVVNLDKPVVCDSVILTVLETHGTKEPKIFEIRVY
jgi:hypothetical protein